jgi:hypothetical protein
MAAVLKIRDAAGTLRTITQVKVRDGGNTLRTCSFVKVRDTTNTLRTVYSTGAALSASASPSFTFGITLGTGTAVTDSTTVTPSGGTAPYTYAWTVLSYTHPTTSPTINNPTSATTAFTQTGIVPGGGYGAVMRCTVTDAAAATTTVDVDASFTDAS